MYEHKEKHVVFDEYGECIDTKIYEKEDDLMLLGMNLNPSALSHSRSNSSTLLKTDTYEEVPSKSVSHDQKVQIECGITHINFDGISDINSIKNILKDLNPRKMILTHSLPEEKHSLQDFATKNLKTQTEIARASEPIEIQSENTAYKVEVRNAIMNSLSLVECSDQHHLAFIDAIVTSTTGPHPVLSHTPITHGHVPLIIGDIPLSDLRSSFIKSGFRAEFIEGVLVINETVLVKKLGPQYLGIDGCLSQDLFRVKDFILSQHILI